MLSPDEFKKTMELIAKNGDIEIAHANADDLMSEVLKDLGYKEGIAIFEDMEKWYA